MVTRKLIIYWWLILSLAWMGCSQQTKDRFDVLEGGFDTTSAAFCGACQGGGVCENGICVCADSVRQGCREDNVWSFDSCGNPEWLVATCEHGCRDGGCIGCNPACTDRRCGPDGCGGVCGKCEGGLVCRYDLGRCHTEGMPDCSQLQCSPDPICGTSCGKCEVPTDGFDDQACHDVCILWQKRALGKEVCSLFDAIRKTWIDSVDDGPGRMHNRSRI